ncbi:hypothetical protein DMO16_23310 [Fictibacillus sp. S7]|nr:hypothetical protein DMO16_23310 [Fictibacillus sp. S7]
MVCFACELKVPGLPRPILHLYKKIVAQTMAVVCATNLSMFSFLLFKGAALYHEETVIIEIIAGRPS